MRKPYRSIMLAALVALSSGIVASAQAPADQAKAPSPFTSPGPITPLKVQIVVSRFVGEKKVSSLPYIISVNANDGFIDPAGEYTPRGGAARIRTGAEIPVLTTTVPKEITVGPTGPVTYRNIGTSIDCSAHTISDGRFRVIITLSDTSIYTEGETAPGAQKLNDMPSFRTFQSHNALFLKDGQSTEFTAGADRVTGALTKVSVTLTVEK